MWQDSINEDINIAKRQTFVIFALSSLIMEILISFIFILFISSCLIGLDTVILWQALYIKNLFSQCFLDFLCLQKQHIAYLDLTIIFLFKTLLSYFEAMDLKHPDNNPVTNISPHIRSHGQYIHYISNFELEIDLFKQRKKSHQNFYELKQSKVWQRNFFLRDKLGRKV